MITYLIIGFVLAIILNFLTDNRKFIFFLLITLLWPLMLIILLLMFIIKFIIDLVGN